MIVRRLRLHPFGCFADRELAFAPGLTVVLGPNEAGKSTFFHALRHALFLPTALAKPQAAKYVRPYLPASGGDTIRVELDFEAAGNWRLSRSWGAAPASELRGPAGRVHAADAAVQQALDGLLRPARAPARRSCSPARRSLPAPSRRWRATGRMPSPTSPTFSAPRCSRPAGSRWILSARCSPERIEEAYANWDRERGQPRNNRGIENPWKKPVGEVLDAWYAKERLRQSASAARAWERRLDELNSRLRDASAAADERDAFVNGHAKAAADARDRGRLEAEAGTVRLEIAALTQAAAEWPAAGEKARAASEAIGELDAARAALEQERRSAELEEGARALREKAQRVERRKTRLEEARRKLGAVPRMERKSLEEIRGAAREVERLQAGLEAGKLSVTVAGRKDIRIAVQEDFAAQADRSLAAGQVLRLQAGGRIRVVHPDMEIEVRSGQADAESRVQKAQEAQKRLAAALAASGAATPAEAESRWSAYEPLSADLVAAEKALAEELAGETLSAFEKRVAALGSARAGRALADVAAELSRRNAEAEAKRRDLDSLRERIAGWEQAHGSNAKLIGKLADASASQKVLAEQIARCAPLPAGFTDAESFLRAWEDARRAAQKLRADESTLRAERAGLLAHSPDKSSEETDRELADAEAAFQWIAKRAQAHERISRAAEALAGASDAAVTSVMRADLERTLAAMTADRYARLEMEGALPRAIAARGGTSLGWELLSVGTKDSLALALRLVMARHFLARADGFLVMDDPLVDMDPDRQGAAAGALREFASQRQLILFTCHPATARMLGGTLVEL